MKPLRLSSRAERDLTDIYAWLVDHGVGDADEIEEEIFHHLDIIQEMPRAYRLRLEYGDRIRICRFGHYSIVYEAADDGVRVLRIRVGWFDPETLWH